MPSSIFEYVSNSPAKTSVIETVKTIVGNPTNDIFIIDRALGEKKYSLENSAVLVVLIPGHKILLINCGETHDRFQIIADDFIEDIGILSDKFDYKGIIGRPRFWRKKLILILSKDDIHPQVITDSKLTDLEERRGSELIISLLTGSINDAVRVGKSIPGTTLQKLKRKIILFDGDQTRFIYDRLHEGAGHSTRIQGLSGTGKTELLLHRLKELYLSSDNSKIVVTCHNKILAESLLKRIPNFFNFMRVEQQIKWEERLWCMHAWGSGSNPDSGTYSNIVNFYAVPFQSYSRIAPFSSVCKSAIDAIKLCGRFIAGHKPFDYILIDESQDFPEEFFELCKLSANKHTIIAGDIFQSIFDENIVKDTAPDHLLSKCYRTDPRTLMFAHAMGMGLYETPKIRWLNDNEWEACGYNITKSGDSYEITRDPIRRFDDLLQEENDSVKLYNYENGNIVDLVDKTTSIISSIKEESPDVTPADIGVIFIDSNKAFYSFADLLCAKLTETHGWNGNKAYESKASLPDTVLISNQNNVKGLEFPYIICVAGVITGRLSSRNSLYMMITRSFICTHLLISDANNAGILKSTNSALADILHRRHIHTTSPSAEEILAMQATIKLQNVRKSLDEKLRQIFDEIKVIAKARPILSAKIKRVIDDEDGYDKLKEYAEFLYGQMS